MNPGDCDPTDPTRSAAGGAVSSTSFGSYHLLQKIGEGGMGEVWVAEQTHPVRRQVALKIIKSGMDTKQVVARFEAERQALALMNHPAIAAVFDGGSTPEGRPYFAMEYVKGEPLVAYCDRHKLDTRARLELFILVCEGVQHAHQKGIIHRDLKPSNVLVTIQQDKPVPKIIDFGISKATNQPLTERTVFTEMGLFVGTPEYMSPEQAELTGADIDTRTDVYALGVLLYELLTGSLPFDRRALLERGLDEIRRTIREVEPPRPSTRVTELGGTSVEAAKNRHTDPARLASQLRGDLDWITMKAIEKDRTRRYDTALGLAADVRRHLANEPVAAGPPSAWYRGTKFARRHRFGLAAVATLILLLVVFGTAMAAQARRIARERDRASREAAVAQQVTEFLVGMFETPDPFQRAGRSLTVVDALDRGAERVSVQLRDQPEVRFSLTNTMARVYYALGAYDRAGRLAEEALHEGERLFGRNSLEFAAALNTLGAVRVAQAAYGPAEAMLRESMAIRESRLGHDSGAVAESLNTIGVLRETQGDWPGAERMLRDALAVRRRIVPATDLTLATSLNNLAIVLSELDKAAESEALHQEALAIRREQLGAGHPLVAQSLNNIGMLLVRQRKDREAEPLFEEALAINRKAVGDEHPVVSSNLNNLALVALNTNNLPKAEDLFRRVVELDGKILGASHPKVADSTQSLGVVLTRQKKFAEAEKALNEALALKRASYPPGHWSIATTANLLGACLADEGKYAAAEPLLLDSREVIAKQFGPAHDRTKRATARLVSLYERWGRPRQAARYRADLASAK